MAANVLINSAILISGGGLNRKEQVNTLLLGAASAGMNASLGLVAVTVMWTQPGTLWAAAVPPIALYLAYRAYVAQREKGQRIQALYEATKALLRSPEIDAAMLVAVRHARSMFDAERAEIQVFRSDAAGEAFRTFVGPDDEVVVMEQILLDSEGLSAEALRTGRPQLGPCSTAGHGSPGRTVAHQMAAPVDGPEGINGIILVSEPLADNRSFNSGDLRFLETLASQISVSLENGRLENSLADVTKLKDDLHFRALHDVLTGLGNRALLWEALSKLDDPTRGQRQSAMLLLDLGRLQGGQRHARTPGRRSAPGGGGSAARSVLPPRRHHHSSWWRRIRDPPGPNVFAERRHNGRRPYQRCPLAAGGPLGQRGSSAGNHGHRPRPIRHSPRRADATGRSGYVRIQSQAQGHLFGLRAG